MTNPKVLTDIRIPQSAEWCKKTHHIDDIEGSSWFLFTGPFFSKMTRFFKLIIFIRTMRCYDVIVTTDMFTAQLVALFRRVFSIKRPQQIILELMLDEEKNTQIWKSKRLFQRYVFKYVDTIFVSSSNEIESYSTRLDLPKVRFRFLAFHTNITNPERLSKPDSYIFAAGRSGRDYATLVSAVQHLPVNLVIVADSYSIKGVEIPDNVRLEVDISYERYIELLQDCWFVVVPLHKLIRSTGQVVFLEAMAFGKPVITTDVVGTRDYIQAGYNGILVPPYDVEALKSSISKLISDDMLQEKLSNNGFINIQKNHTLEKYVSTILQTTEELFIK